MSEDLTLDAIQEAVSKVEHPEIAATLMDLGMLRDFAYNTEENAFSFTLVVPSLRIPESIRDYMINAVAQAAHALGVKKFRVTVEPMDAGERAHFMAMEQSKWRADGQPGSTPGCGI